jgi:UDP-2,3-diacylglucosamine hydrolase
MSKSTAYFVSDAHLGIAVPGFDKREPDLLAFLRSIAGQASHLYIMGDLFDFWIEYKRLIRSDYFETIHVLRELTAGGTEIHYMAGNHDFALGPFLPEKVGITTHANHWETQLQGKRLHLFHGDGILKADVGYRFMRGILRNPFNQRLYKMLHPTIGIGLATRLSGASRHFLSPLHNDARLVEYRLAALSYLDKGCDVVVFGHTHRAELRLGDGKTYCNTGEWIRRYNYAAMRDGVMTLWQHIPGGADQAIPAMSLK